MKFAGKWKPVIGRPTEGVKLSGAGNPVQL